MSYSGRAGVGDHVRVRVWMRGMRERGRMITVLVCAYRGED